MKPAGQHETILFWRFFSFKTSNTTKIQIFGKSTICNHFGADVAQSSFSDHKQWLCTGIFLVFIWFEIKFLSLFIWICDGIVKAESASLGQVSKIQIVRKSTAYYFQSLVIHNQYKQITANLFVSDQIQWLCIGDVLVFFRLFPKMKYVVKMKCEHRKLKSKADVLGSLKFIYKFKRFTLIKAGLVRKNYLQKQKLIVTAEGSFIFMTIYYLKITTSK